MYHQSIEDLKEGDQIWVADYIENFSTFSKIELQQDYYNKEQVAIFITMVIRWRKPDEDDSLEVQSYMRMHALTSTM